MASVLAADDVPGDLSHEDRKRVALGFNSLCSRDASVHTSALRIVDTLDTRFVFVVTHPRNLDATALKSLRLKLELTRSVVLDIPRRRVSVECWRQSGADVPQRGKGTKRRRAVEQLQTLPGYIQTALADCAPRKHHLDVLSEILLWVVNYDDFCAFEFSAARDDARDAYNLSLSAIDAVPDTFVAEIMSRWRSFVKDVVISWSSQALTICVGCD